MTADIGLGGTRRRRPTRRALPSALNKAALPQEAGAGCAQIWFNRPMEAPPPAPETAEPDANAAEELPNFTHRQIRQVIIGVLLCLLLSAIDQTVVVPAVPSIAADLDGFGHLSWIVSAYLLTSTAATPILGKLSDAYGRRNILMPSIVLFTIASLLCAVSQTLTQLIAARALQGIGGAGLMAMTQAAIADVVSPRERGRYQAYMAGTWAVASIAGPVLGGWVTDHLSWRWIFWINLPIGVIAYALSSSALRLLVVRGRKSRIDYPGAALLSSAIVSGLLVVSWGGGEYGWGSPVILGLGALCVVSMLVLRVQARRSPDPLLPPRLFANGVFTRGVLVASLVSSSMFGATFLLPLFFQLVRGADASDAGGMIVPYLGATCLGAYASGQLARRIGRAKLMIQCGLAVCILGFVVLSMAGPATSLWVIAGAMTVMGIGVGFCQPSTMVAVQNAVERRDLGAGTGALLVLRSMGGAVGSTMAGTILSARFATGLAARGQPLIDLGAMHGPQSEHELGPAVFDAAQASLTQALHWSFGACALVVVVAFVLCWGMEDLKLRSRP